MEWSPHLSELQRVLAQLYRDEASARRIAREAGLAEEQIDWAGSQLNRWHAVLVEATKCAQVKAICDIAQREYPKTQPLLQVIRSLGLARPPVAAEADSDRNLCTASVSARGRLAEFTQGLDPYEVIVLDAVVAHELNVPNGFARRGQIRTIVRRSFPTLDIPTITRTIERMVGSLLQVAGGPDPGYQVTLHGLLASSWGMNAIEVIDGTLTALGSLHEHDPALFRYSWGFLQKELKLPETALNLVWTSIQLSKLGQGLFESEGDRWWAAPADLDEILEQSPAVNYVRGLIRSIGASRTPSTEDIDRSVDPIAAAHKNCESMKGTSTMTSDNLADVVILTALRKERDAVLRHFGGVKETRVKGRNAHRASISSAVGGTAYDVVILCMQDMGNVKAAIATTQAIDVWSPAYVVLAGISGGLQGGNRVLGDVLVGEQIVHYEPGKQEPGQLVRRYQAYRPAKALLDTARVLSPQDWVFTVHAPRPDGTTGRVVPHVHFGVVASGEKVVKDPDLVDELKSDWAQLIGLEMEAAGAATAVYETGSAPGILMAKGICDWLDPKKEDGWQEYAAATSAAFISAILHRLVAPGETRPQPVRREQPAYAGPVKVKLCSRLTSDWQDLADYFEIPISARARFDRGREPHGVWEWLEARRKLGALRESLEYLGRHDLVEEFLA